MYHQLNMKYNDLRSINIIKYYTIYIDYYWTIQEKYLYVYIIKIK